MGTGIGVRSLAVVLAVVWVFAGNAGAAVMMGIDANTGTLWDINPATAAISNPRATTVSRPMDLAIAPNQSIFSGDAGGTSLFTINRTSGATSMVGPTGLQLIEGALAFTSGGVLFGAHTRTDIGGNFLVRLNTTTGAATIVGSMTGSDDVSAMTFGKDGKLYALDTNTNTTGVPALYTLNPVTGAILTTVTVSGGPGGDGALAGMAQDPDTGTFYVAENTTRSLYTLNVTTGAASLVGSPGALGSSVSGIAFLPEPSLATDLLLAGASLCAIRRRGAIVLDQDGTRIRLHTTALTRLRA